MNSLKKYTKLIVLLMMVLTSGFTMHKYYMSLTQIDHNKEVGSLEITIKLFTDDFEKAIEQGTTEKLHLGTDKESVKADDLIKKYLNKHFTLKVNGIPMTYSYVGKEVDIEVAWVYLEVKNVKTINSITVTNSLMTEVIPEQKNVVKLNVNGNYSSHVMSKSDSEKKFEF